MAQPTVIVVGLGPGDGELMTTAARTALSTATVARLRTRRHPAAALFPTVESYDDWYDEAESFEELYERIVEDVVGLARTSPTSEMVYAVPGSPMVAERTVELLVAREDVRVMRQPAVSVIDVACAALGRDPMAVGLRVVDALDGVEAFRGPGPLLILQTYSSEVLATTADRLSRDTPVTVVHHAGLPDQVITTLPAQSLATFAAADHLTSLWVDDLRTAGVAMDDLVDLMRTLRRECPWDQEQTHTSLTRHLLEESYEALDALEAYDPDDLQSDPAHVIEELGDVLFQVVFHAELGSEDDRFDAVTIADGVREKLISRHPHVFEGVEVDGADDVASRWETLKRAEKQRSSVTDGIALQLPALSLYAKMRRKALSVGVPLRDEGDLRERIAALVTALDIPSAPVSDAMVDEAPPAWGDILAGLEDLARVAGIDLEAVVRERALRLREEIRAYELAQSPAPEA